MSYASPNGAYASPLARLIVTHDVLDLAQNQAFVHALVREELYAVGSATGYIPVELSILERLANMYSAPEALIEKIVANAGIPTLLVYTPDFEYRAMHQEGGYEKELSVALVLRNNIGSLDGTSSNIAMITEGSFLYISAGELLEKIDVFRSVSGPTREGELIEKRGSFDPYQHILKDWVVAEINTVLAANADWIESADVVLVLMPDTPLPMHVVQVAPRGYGGSDFDVNDFEQKARDLNVVLDRVLGGMPIAVDADPHEPFEHGLRIPLSPAKEPPAHDR